MTLQEFIRDLQGYYGLAYRPGQQPAIAQYLSVFGPSELQSLYDETLRGVSSAYKTLPDIAAFEEARTRIAQDRLQDRPEIYTRFQLSAPEEGTLSRDEVAQQLQKLANKFSGTKQETVRMVLGRVIGVQVPETTKGRSHDPA